ncbi:MAG: M28 family peptidase [Phycisphaerales bacterium]|nr:MAG: M28 family peptidase [Phycisphaerales bacterium]
MNQPNLKSHRLPLFLTAIGLALTLGCASTGAAPTEARRVELREIFEGLGENATLWYQHVQTLANPYFEGRLPSTEGHDLAADYIRFYFDLYGLEPGFPDPDEAGELRVSYRQPFEFSRAGEQAQVEVTGAALSLNGQTLERGEDFVVLGNSDSGSFTGPLSFIGYGIEDGPDGYSSFDEDTDLNGRIALLLRYEPLDESGRSRWADRRFSEHAAMAFKMQAAKDRGAAAILMVTPPGVVDGRRGLESLNRSSRFGHPLGIPVLQITPETAEAILQAASGIDRDLTVWRKLADAGEIKTVNLSPHLRATVRTEVERYGGDRQNVPAQNVGAVLPGKGDLADEWVVIGAHYDHMGHGQLGGIRGSIGRLHPGADDNASGTAGVLVMARMLSQYYAQADEDADLRSVFFLAFDAEEMGLHGSREFVVSPPIPLEQTALCLNFDMIGRLREGDLDILGAGTGDGLTELMQPHIDASGLDVSLAVGGSGSSDDANFHASNVPAVHFFTGMTREFTSPADQAYTVNPAGAMQVLDLAYAIALDVASRPEKLAYTEPGASRGQDRGMAKVRLGIQPGMNESLDRGLLVERVSLETSAHEGGMKDGDIILDWDGAPINSMRDLFTHLQDHEPGDVVIITVKRGEEIIDLRVTLKASTGRRQ